LHGLDGLQRSPCISPEARGDIYFISYTIVFDTSELSIMKKVAALALLLFCMALSAQEVGEYTDARDGKVYKTVQIGSQVWMSENLNYVSNSPKVIFPNNPALTDVFGRLYCWEIAMEVCPDGWHLPSDEEWKALADHLGGESIAGSKMKKISNYWVSLNEEASDVSGFSALPGGYQEDPDDAVYPFMGEMGFFWSTKEKSGSVAWFRYVKYDGNLLKAGNGDKEFGMSVRCLKD
jgi:uncharacterized protein (TIGR02145 family)